MIDYKTYDEQIAILQNRGMIITDIESAKERLIQNNYYNLINGYKDIFVQVGVTPEIYINGVTFDEIYALHQFDKELRSQLSHILIIIEREFGSILSHEFSRNYRNHDLDYLDINNYNTAILTPDNISGAYVIEASQLINDDKGLNNTLIKALNENDPMICHYKKHYNRIPLWVFVNKLSFGTLSKMYKLFQSRERDAIAKSIGNVSSMKIYADDVQKAVNVLVLLRNKCAHDQRVYDFTPKRTTIKSSPFLSKYLSPTDNKNTLFGALSCIAIFLQPTIFNKFLKNIKTTTSNLLNEIHSIPTANILKKMGMPITFLR